MFDYKNYIKKQTLLICPRQKNIDVVKPPTEDMGDFSIATFSINVEGTNNPVEKSNYITNFINVDKTIISEVTSAGPYVNFKINKDHLAKNVIQNIFELNEKYGSYPISIDKKMLIEHTSINPNASPHIGRARNSIIGDFLVRLYRFLGYDVEVNYYINDIGKQIAMLIVGIERMCKNKDIDFNEMLDIYVRINEESKNDESILTEVFNYLNELENGNEEVKNKFKEITDICVKGQQKIFDKMDIKFDVFKHESDFVFEETTNIILNELNKKQKLKEDENGRLYVDLTGYNIPTRTPVLILTRKDKTSLYPLRDIAYTIYKINKNSKNNFIVLGEDQEVYMQQITAVMDILGYNAPELVSYSFVLLNGDKMATREGKVVLLEDFIEKTKEKLLDSFKKRNDERNDETLTKLAASCIKFNILDVNRRRNVNFNLEKAINFQGDSAIYLIYNYSRINSILLKSKMEKDNLIRCYTFNKELEYSLLKDLYDFCDIIKLAVNTKESIHITRYLHNLTQKFSKYYNDVPILIEEDREIKYSRLALLQCIKTVLENGMKILGIDYSINL